MFSGGTSMPVLLPTALTVVIKVVFMVGILLVLERLWNTRGSSAKSFIVMTKQQEVGMPGSDNPAVTMLELVTVLKEAIAVAEKDTPSVTIKKASLELKAQMIEKVGGGLDLTPLKIPIKFGAELKTTGVQTIHLDFELVKRKTAGLTDDDKTRLHQGLVQAINTVKIAVQDAQKPVADPNLPNLSFKSAEVTLNFILDQEGHITFLGFEKALELAASVAAEYTNTIKLTLESA